MSHGSLSLDAQRSGRTVGADPTETRVGVEEVVDRVPNGRSAKQQQQCLHVVHTYGEGTLDAGVLAPHAQQEIWNSSQQVAAARGGGARLLGGAAPWVRRLGYED